MAAESAAAAKEQDQQLKKKEEDMSLLDRVSTLLRANLNDLVEKAEDPERMLKQIVLDMENQLLQVKTQVAIAIADQHLLEKSGPSTSTRRPSGAPRRNWPCRRDTTTWRARHSSAR